MKEMLKMMMNGFILGGLAGVGLVTVSFAIGSLLFDITESRRLKKENKEQLDRIVEMIKNRGEI